mgnify:CR=1 FL=1
MPSRVTGDQEVSVHVSVARRPGTSAAVSTACTPGAARAAMFPKISLTTAIGVASSALSSLFQSGAFSYSAGGGVSYPIFQAGAGKAGMASAKAQRDAALASYEKRFGVDAPETAGTVGNLGALYLALSLYAKAEPLLKRSLALREKSLSPEGPEIGQNLMNLGSVYLGQARYAEADSLLKRALGICEKTLQPNHPDLGRVVGNLGRVYVGKKQFAEAEPLLKRAWAIQEKALGPNHPDVAGPLGNLGWLADERGHFEEAEQLYKRALAIYEKSLGPDHPDTLTSVNNLGVTYHALGRHDSFSRCRRVVVRVAVFEGLEQFTA